MINEKAQEKLLYNLMTNKYENPNKFDKYPEIAQKLENAIFAWRKIHSDPLWPSVVYFGVEKDGKTYYFEQ
jgi:hypothetical protein